MDDNNITCLFCGLVARISQGHGDIFYIICTGCGAVTSFANLIDENEPLSRERTIRMYMSGQRQKHGE